MDDIRSCCTYISFAVLAMCALTSCTYTATHAPLPPTTMMATASSDKVLIALDAETANRIAELHHGGDTWKVDVGPTILDVIPQIMATSFGAVSTVVGAHQPSVLDAIRIEIALKEFSIDFASTVFGRNDCTMTLSGAITMPKDAKQSPFEVVGTGSGSGSDFKETYLVVLVGPMGRTGMSKAIGKMLTECAADAARKIVDIVVAARTHSKS